MPARLPGFVFPAVSRGISLVGSKCESNEFSSGEEKSFGSESRVNSRRVMISRSTFTPRFSVRRWHGIKGVAAVNLAATPPPPSFLKGFQTRLEGIFERFSKACPHSSWSRGQGVKGFLLQGEHIRNCSPFFATARTMRAVSKEGR